MAYPLINPYQQFFDSSGDPLVSGTIEFRDPVSNALINSYPTADDADAQTNANDNPLTLAATGAAPTGLYLENGVDYKVILKDSSGNIITTQDDVLCPSDGYPQSSLESAAGIVPTDKTYEWGNVFRYGAVADSGSGSQGTDNAAAFQAAIDSGHAVYVPEGWYAVESTIEVFDKATAGNTGVHMQFSAGARLERYANVATPVLHISGTGHKIEGNGATIAARTYGGFNKGLVLLGADPAITSNTDDSCLDTINNWITDLKIIGSNSVGTDWDGSVGLYLESPGRKRGEFITPTVINCFYNTIMGVYCTQWDYPFFLSTDANANSLTGCTAFSFGHAAFWINGYANQITDCKIEQSTAQDTTERYAFNFGNKNSGPESVHIATDYDATEYTVTGITKGATTKLDVSADPTGTVAVADKIKVTGVVDSGAGDLEAALNTGHFEVTARDATSITISADTSGDSATWSSGGTVSDSIYPITGARANQVHGFCELVLNASTKVMRLIGCTLPVGAYDTGTFETTYGRNIVRVSGTFPGGIGPSGFSTSASLLNNTVDVTSVGYTDYQRPARFHDFTITKLDDETGSSYGGDQYRTFAGRMASAAESTPYNVLTIDNVGAGNGAVAIRLWYLMREDTNDDCEVGEIGWLCPVAGDSNQTAIKYKDFQGNYNAAAQPYITWTITDAAGTASNTGKFTVVATTGDPAGADNTDLDISWRIDIIAEYGASLDWDNDVTITNGGL